MDILVILLLIAAGTLTAQFMYILELKRNIRSYIESDRQWHQIYHTQHAVIKSYKTLSNPNLDFLKKTEQGGPT